MARIDVVQMLRDAERVAASELNAIRAAIKAMTSSVTASISTPPKSRRRTGGGEVTHGNLTRHRRRMSAAARKAVSERMRKYWAARRAKAK